MKNISLSELIKNSGDLKSDHCAVVSASKILKYSEIVNIPAKMHGKRVALYIADTFSFISTLVSLDGAAKVLCPIPVSVNKEDLFHLLTLSEFDVLVSDMQENLGVFTDQSIECMTVDGFNSSSDEQIHIRNTSTVWLIPTSGTTSKPKLVKHHINTLAASAIESKKFESSVEIWGLFYEITRYAGYQVLFNSLLNGHTLVSSLPSEQIYHRIQLCADNGVTHISATPTQWRKILMVGEDIQIPLKQIILGGEASDQQILNALKKSFPSAKITHTYASTEVGLSLSVSDGLAGFPLHFSESSKGEVEVTIKNEKLLVRSPSNAIGYSDDTDFRDTQGWIDTGDIVEIKNDRFFIIGRANGMINIAGDKVNPESIRQVFLTHSQIVEVRVYGKKNAITGMLLCADVQLLSEVDEEVKISVIAFAKDKLQEKDRPRIINFVDQISISATGKIG